MNKALESRTKREFYKDAIEKWKAAGLPESEITAQVDEYIKEYTLLYNGTCPQCGEPVARYVDHNRQQGDKGGMPGGWAQYRCSTAPPPGTLRPDGVCDYMLDVVEGELAS